MLYGYMTPFVSKFPREAFLNYRDLDLGINHNGRYSYLEGAVYGIKYFKGNFNRLVQIKTKVCKEDRSENPKEPWTIISPPKDARASITALIAPRAFCQISRNHSADTVGLNRV
ncbi:hypothetical protein RJ639_041672 [Escallonia herrerae]|uniref:Berberine/berberine-like domain-containing protein n=1 Tax=Escallonia herrerae TaxID=1293975 RepID=A0AA89BAJ2_9ASTE|nr:hypothetical protein RJ639_041672 [Escallonia herrerae]